MKRIKYKGSWILAYLFIVSIFAASFQRYAQAVDGNLVIFSWQNSYISQSVNSVDTSGKSSLTLNVSAAEFQDWKESTDELNIGISLYGPGGGLIYQHSTGTIYIDTTSFNNYSLTINSSDVTAWNQVDSISIFIYGKDGEFWAGNYGTQIESASLKFDDGIELLSNTEFTQGESNWASNVGWQSCSGGSGGSPCVLNAPVPTTTTTTPINNSPYSLGLDMVWGTANEGWDLSLSAPGGGTFNKVVFASYGNPTGSDGIFSQEWCHATNSIQKVSEVFIGQSSGTIASSNGIFGDPCGGTYKSLFVVLQYTGGLPNTTTTTTPPPPPSCGPYEKIIVTGETNGGSVWGSGPYTDDSDMDVAAVHAGLVDVGETATLIPVNIAYHLSYPGSTANGVSTEDWLFGWCGFDLSIDVPPTTTTTNTTTTTTTTTLAPTTTIKEEPTTTTIKPTTTTEESTTTTIKSLIDIDLFTTTTTTTTVAIPTTTEPEKITISATTSTTTSTTTSIPTTTTSTLPIATTTTTTPALVQESNEQKVEEILKNPDAEQALNLISSGTLNEEQVQQIVESVLQEEISSDVAEKLATNPEVIQNINGDQASDVFASIDTSQLTGEDKSLITEAVQEAPEEVRNAFEGEINIYAEGFDDYVPVGSNIDVGARRTLLAATTVLTGAAASMAANGGSGPRSGGSGPGSGGAPSGGSSGGSGNGQTGGQNNAARKEEEEGSEDEDEAPEIEGPDGEEDESEFTRNSIFKYTEGTMERRFSPWGFVKKFAKETAALAFTISGTVIVFVTLSGDTRKVTIIATSCAFAVHYLHVMLKKDE